MENYVDFQAFEKNYRDAAGYHRRAEQFVEEGKQPGLIFNVASIAIERYLIALCELYGAIPFNHNYNSLMRTVEEVIEVPSALNQSIRSLDSIFGICSIDDYFHGNPDSSDTSRALLMCNEILQLFDQARISLIRSFSEN